MARRRAHTSSGTPARTASWPLRKILRSHLAPLTPGGTPVWRDLLGCGHLVFPARDLFGETHPDRRRCWKCARAWPPDLDPHTPEN